MDYPNDFYAVLAGINGTIVAIIGGFLLTWGLQRRGELRRYSRLSNENTAAVEQAVARSDQLKARHEQPTADAAHPAAPAHTVSRVQAFDDYLQAVQAQRDRKAAARDSLARELDAYGTELQALQRQLDSIDLTINELSVDRNLAFSGFVMLAVISLVGVLLPLWLIAEPGNAPAFVTPSFLFRLHAILLVVFGVFLWHALFPESVTINDQDRSGVLKDVPTMESGGRLDGLDRFALGLFSAFFAADLLITGPDGLESTLRSFWIIGLIGVVALTPRYFLRRRRLLARLRTYPATPDKP